MKDNIENLLINLSKSNFRSRFHLKEIDKKYVQNKGMEVIREHARDFIDKRIAPKELLNDGKQTPMRGHPVFIAQHATATCCRECINKWHKLNKNAELTNDEKEYLVNVIMKWIENEMKNNC